MLRVGLDVCIYIRLKVERILKNIVFVVVWLVIYIMNGSLLGKVVVLL